ncbi:MAG TPA: hypothetical protein VF132_00050 [Rudaea sp.]
MERPVRISWAAIATLVLMGAAVALHAYEQLAKSAEPSPIWFLWSMFPYSVCLLILLSCDSALPAAFGTAAALIFDFFGYHTVFVAPKASTSAIAFLFLPLWSAFVITPVVMFVVWLAVRWYTRRTRTAEPA